MATSQINQVMPSLAVLPQEEWEEVKALLKEVKEKLQEKLTDNANSQWIESADARKMLGVSPKTWQTYRDTRVIPFSQFGRKIYVRRADIEAYMMSHYIDSEKGGNA